MHTPGRRKAVVFTRLSLRILVGSLLLLAGLPGSLAATESISVRTIALGTVWKTPAFSAPATVVARNQPQLAAEIDARIIELPVAVGDRVAQGDVVARLDCRQHESMLAAARAELKRARAQQRLAKAQLTRARNLTKKQSISEELLDQRNTELAVARAETATRDEAVRRAGIHVADCALRAPFDAVVTARLGSVGGFASRGSPIIDLLEVAGQEVSVALRRDQIDGVKRAARLTFESNGAGYPVRLRAVLPSADPVARTREARLVFTDRPTIAGTAGRVVWEGHRKLLPADFLARRDGRLGVFVLENGRARFIELPAAQDGRPVAIELPPSTLLITEGRQRLRDGDAVRPVTAAELVR